MNQYGVAKDVKSDGYVNPSQVRICNSKEQAEKLVNLFGGTVVSRPEPNEWSVVKE